MEKRTVMWLAIGLILAVLLLIVGYYGIVNRPDDESNEKVVTVDATVNIGVRVLDLVNNSPVTGAPVYLAVCCPDNASLRDVRMSGVTGDDGWALFAANYTVDRNQTIYVGASNREALVASDISGRAFDGSGYLGAWKAFNYSVLYNSRDHQALISCTITVDLDSGKML